MDSQTSRTARGSRRRQRVPPPGCRAPRARRGLTPLPSRLLISYFWETSASTSGSPMAGPGQAPHGPAPHGTARHGPPGPAPCWRLLLWKRPRGTAHAHSLACGGVGSAGPSVGPSVRPSVRPSCLRSAPAALAGGAGGAGARGPLSAPGSGAARGGTSPAQRVRCLRLTNRRALVPAQDARHRPRHPVSSERAVKANRKTALDLNLATPVANAHNANLPLPALYSARR